MLNVVAQFWHLMLPCGSVSLRKPDSQHGRAAAAAAASLQGKRGSRTNTPLFKGGMRAGEHLSLCNEHHSVIDEDKTRNEDNEETLFPEGSHQAQHKRCSVLNVVAWFWHLMLSCGNVSLRESDRNMERLLLPLPQAFNAREDLVQAHRYLRVACGRASSFHSVMSITL